MFVRQTLREFARRCDRAHHIADCNGVLAERFFRCGQRCFVAARDDDARAFVRKCPARLRNRFRWLLPVTRTVLPSKRFMKFSL